MKVKVKKVYYCDFCKKHSLKNVSLHEKHCTANPDRVCRLCGRKDISLIIPKYKIIPDKEWFTEGNSVLGEVKAKIDEMVKGKIQEMRDEVENCPACILTILRCNQYKFPIEPHFDFKKELEEWWADKNEERYQENFYEWNY